MSWPGSDVNAVVVWVGVSVDLGLDEKAEDVLSFRSLSQAEYIMCEDGFVQREEDMSRRRKQFLGEYSLAFGSVLRSGERLR